MPKKKKLVWISNETTWTSPGAKLKRTILNCWFWFLVFATSLSLPQYWELSACGLELLYNLCQKKCTFKCNFSVASPGEGGQISNWDPEGVVFSVLFLTNDSCFALCTHIMYVMRMICQIRYYLFVAH